MADDPLQIAEHAVVTVGDRKQPVNHVRSGNVQPFPRDFWVLEIEEKIGFVAELLRDRGHSSTVQESKPIQMQNMNAQPPNVKNLVFPESNDFLRPVIFGLCSRHGLEA